MNNQTSATIEQHAMTKAERTKLIIICSGILLLALLSGFFGVAMLALMKGLNALVLVTAPVLIFIALLLALVSRKYGTDIINNVIEVHCGAVKEKQRVPGIGTRYFVSLGGEFHQINATQFNEIEIGTIITIRKAPKLGMTLSITIQD